MPEEHAAGSARNGRDHSFLEKRERSEPHTRAIPRHKGGSLVAFGRQVDPRRAGNNYRAAHPATPETRDDLYASQRRIPPERHCETLRPFEPAPKLWSANWSQRSVSHAPSVLAHWLPGCAGRDRNVPDRAWRQAFLSRCANQRLQGLLLHIHPGPSLPVRTSPIRRRISAHRVGKQSYPEV